MLVGDYVHNVRSALDHVVWQLVIANRGAPGRHTQFPIALTEKHWRFARAVEHRQAPDDPQVVTLFEPEDRYARQHSCGFEASSKPLETAWGAARGLPQAPLGSLRLLSMAGARFVRADLHVHTYPDTEADPAPDLAAYVHAALAAEIGVLAITDHNRVSFAREAIKAANDKPLLLLPGIEISTHDGHLLGLFAPRDIAALEAFAAPTHLGLKQISQTETRSNRSMLDLVDEIHERGGLAIPAHVDATDGLHDKVRPGVLVELLSSHAIAGLEFATHEALSEWFTDQDPHQGRREAWKARQRDHELKERGLARLMSSDAHSVAKVGQDRSSRTLTRLRLDDANFDAVKNAVLFNPKARCKAEAILPASYPRIVSARFAGGFLDGVEVEFSPNLNCIVGGRGTGKSTALLALRAALGAKLSPEEDADEAQRMPDQTHIRFIDGAGSERTSVRRRGEDPVEPDSGSPIQLRLADLGQEESGRLARGYENDPSILLEFLDGFVVGYQYTAARMLVESYGSGTARAWLLGSNSGLDDEAPAWLLRHAEEPGDVRFLVAAARAFAGKAD